MQPDAKPTPIDRSFTSGSVARTISMRRGAIRGRHCVPARDPIIHPKKEYP